MAEQDTMDEPVGEAPASIETSEARAADGLAWLRWLAFPFVNPDERRLRALWRLVLHALAMLVAAFAIGVAVVSVLLLLDRAVPLASVRAWLRQPSTARLVLATVVQGALATGVTWLACRFLDRRRFAALGLRLDGYVGRDFGFGFVLAASMQALAFFGMLACGWLRVESFAWQRMSPGTLGGSLAAASLAFLAVGWYEELISRGYWLVNLSEGFELRRLGLHGRTSLLVAVLLSSSVFALGHARNPNATVVSTVALVAAGLLLAVPVVRTGQLWMSIGLHFGWNLFEGPVFGFPVSGIPTFQLVRPVVTGPTLWTGGAFGPEAGLLLLVLQVLAAILIWLVTRGRNARPA